MAEPRSDQQVGGGKWFPPFQVQLRFCSVCGRTDRHQHLRAQSFHYGKDGKRCPGTVESITYEITEGTG